VSERYLSLAVWGVLAAAVVAAQLVAVWRPGRFPGLGAAMDRLTAPRGGQLLCVLAWMWLGWHAFAR